MMLVMIAFLGHKNEVFENFVKEVEKRLRGSLYPKKKCKKISAFWWVSTCPTHTSFIITNR